MTPADHDALREGLAELVRSSCGIVETEYGSQVQALLHRTPGDVADAILAGPLAPLLAKAESAERVAAERDEARAEIERLQTVLAFEKRVRRVTNAQVGNSVREQAASLCDEAAAYFDRTTGHYDRAQASNSYRATAKKIRLLTLPRAALRTDPPAGADAPVKEGTR